MKRCRKYAVHATPGQDAIRQRSETSVPPARHAFNNGQRKHNGATAKRADMTTISKTTT